MEVCHEQLENDPSLSQKTSFSVDDICSLLSLCLEATYLLFEGRVYQQIQGTAMGSPVSVVVANLVMEDIERRPLATFHTHPRFWRRYVDDTCTALPHDLVVPSMSTSTALIHTFSSLLRENLEGNYHYLMCSGPGRRMGTISTEVYQKPSHTDQYLAFDSHHPTAHKRAVVRTLMGQAQTLLLRCKP